MTPQYPYSLKKKLCEDVCLHGKSTKKTAKEYGIPIKTFEKWITSYHENNHCFDEKEEPNDFRIIDKVEQSDSYDNLSNEELKKQIMRLEIENARLKKGYMVKEGGMEKKVFVTFSKKNTK